MQGERELAKDNKSLGTFTFNGIAPSKRGIPQIEVTFDINADGILSVTAKDRSTNKQQSITITGASTLPKEEIDKMIKSAEKNAAADKKISERINLKNQTSALCYKTRTQLDEESDIRPQENKKKINDLITKLESAVVEENFAIMKKLSRQLETMVAEMGYND